MAQWLQLHKDIRADLVMSATSGFVSNIIHNSRREWDYHTTHNNVNTLDLSQRVMMLWMAEYIYAWIRVALQTTGRLCGLVYLHFLFAICISRAKYELKQLHNCATCIRWWLGAAWCCWWSDDAGARPWCPHEKWSRGGDSAIRN